MLNSLLGALVRKGAEAGAREVELYLYLELELVEAVDVEVDMEVAEGVEVLVLVLGDPELAEDVGNRGVVEVAHPKAS